MSYAIESDTAHAPFAIMHCRRSSGPTFAITRTADNLPSWAQTPALERHTVAACGNVHHQPIPTERFRKGGLCFNFSVNQLDRRCRF